MKNKYCDEFRLRVSPLHHVMARGSTDMVVPLLQRSHHNLNSRDSAGQTPLYYAIFRGYTFGVRLLVEKGACINIKDNNENTPLHFAVKKGNISIVSDLLMAGADLEQRNNYGQTVLQYAIVWNYSKSFEPMVKLLLSKGARVDTKDKDMETPLHSAAARKDSGSVCLSLLARGANVNDRDKRGNTPLHIASMKQCKQAIITLIDKGANIEEINTIGNTPLHIAVQSRVPESVNLLLELKANINAKNLKGKTVLHMATKLGCVDLVKLLIDHGVSLEETDDQGNTALHCATKSYHGDKTAGILLENGAAVHVYNNCHETPLDLALESYSLNRWNVQDYRIILDWGTTVNSENYIHLPKTLRSDQFETFMKHFIKLKSAKIHLDTGNFGFDLRWCDFLYEFVSCLKEIEKMKASRFNCNTLNDVLLKYSDPNFVMNNDLRETIISPNFECCYPIYGSLIKITFKKAEKRFELLNKAQTSLKIPLPNEIRRKILAYLDEISLLSVITAFQNS